MSYGSPKTKLVWGGGGPTTINPFICQHLMTKQIFKVKTLYHLNQVMAVLIQDNGTFYQSQDWRNKRLKKWIPLLSIWTLKLSELILQQYDSTIRLCASYIHLLV